MSSEFSERQNKSVTRNYGEMLLGLSKKVPDGIVVFFPSYSYMKSMIVDWIEMGIIEMIY